MPSSVQIITFGCRLNSYESEAMRAHAQAAGLGDIVFINTCAVTGEAERQARQAIRKARRENPDAAIIVTGCAVQIHPERYAAMAEVDFVVGNHDKLKAETYAALGAGQAPDVSDIAEAARAEAPIVTGFEGGLTRGFVEVQNGCDHRCTYCIVPSARGASRSVPLETIARQTQTLLDQGYPEIALTGVDIASYGRDLDGQLRLGAMVRQLLALVPDLKRLRLSSLDPAAIDEDLWVLLADEPRLMPHWHLSVQACEDTVLRRMARRHRVKDLEALCARARTLRPDIVFGADLIAGFPAETDGMFERGLKTLEALGLTWLHVFPYSARAGTPAAKMAPVVPMEVRRARAARLREVGQRAVASHLKALVGQRLEVHVEQETLARAPDFTTVRLTAPARVGSVISVECIGSEEGCAIGQEV